MKHSLTKRVIALLTAWTVAFSSVATAAQIKSAGAVQLDAQRSVTLAAATTGESLHFEFGASDARGQQNLSSSTQTGTSIQAGGNLGINAGNSVTGTAASIQAGGAVNLAASGSIVLTEGRSTKSEDLAWVESGGGCRYKTPATTPCQLITLLLAGIW